MSTPIADTIPDAAAPKRAIRHWRLRVAFDDQPVVCKGIARDRDAIDPALRVKLNGLLNGRLPWPFFLAGAAGRGKTCAALCVVDAVPGAVFSTAHQWRDAVYTSNDVLWRIVAPETSLLVVDEVGAARDDWDRERLALTRLADIRQYRPTIWISNHPPERIKQLFDERLYSRICSGTVRWQGGEDRRQTKGRVGSTSNAANAAGGE